jgi:hypothetical protein
MGANRANDLPTNRTRPYCQAAPGRALRTDLNGSARLSGTYGQKVRACHTRATRDSQQRSATVTHPLSKANDQDRHSR